MDNRRPPPGPRIVFTPEQAKWMGFTETERLQLAAGTLKLFSLDDLIRELEAGSGPGEPPKKPEETGP